MKHQNKNISRRLAVAMMAGAMMVSMVGMTAFAATGGTSEVTFKKILTVTDSAAKVPNVTFDYAIAAGEEIPATATTPEIKTGITNGVVIGDAEFTPNMTVTAGSVSKDVSVDFSDVTFPEPGIYRYVITESLVDADDNPDIVNDTNPTRYMDVYVVNPDAGESDYKITSVAMLEKAASIQKEGDVYKYVDSEGNAITAKNAGYEATYNTYALKLKKVIDGDMATMGDTFSFTIKLTEGDAGEQFDYSGQTYTFLSDGTVSITGISLGNESEVTISGIPSDVKYEIVENIAKTEGYTTTATINETPVTVTSSDNAQTVATQNKSASTDNVIVTNTKDAVSPTGIALTVAPYIIMVAAAAGVAVLFLRRRNNEF